jgi:hypothetical protein
MDAISLAVTRVPELEFDVPPLLDVPPFLSELPPRVVDS